MRNHKVQQSLYQRIESAPVDETIPIVVTYKGPMDTPGIHALGEVIRQGADYMKTQVGNLVATGAALHQTLASFYILTAGATRDQIERIVQDTEVTEVMLRTE